MAHILIVDDRPLNREYLLTLLGYGGHTLSEAADGREALERVRERVPDLVISDILMPTMDGVEFVHRLRANPETADLKVIFYTATYRARDARAMADSVSVRWVLAKPAEPHLIMDTVSEALGVSAPAAPAPAARGGPPEPAAGALGHRVMERLAAVQELNLRLATLLEGAVTIAEEQAKSLVTVRALEIAMLEVQSLGLRLTGMLELSQDLAVVHSPEVLVKIFCRSAQDILNTRYAGVAILDADGQQVRHFAAAGMDEATHARVAGEIASCTVTERILRDRRLVIADAHPDGAGLPASHPPVASFLACPMAVRDRVCGWMYAAGRLGGDGFTSDDKRIAQALSAQLAIAWENLTLYAELEQRVADRTAELQSANRELESFSYSVSHDLRAPLRAISGFAGILAQDHAVQLPSEASQLLGRVQENVNRMSALIDDLLEFSRLGRKALSVQPVNLAHLARECLKELNSEQEGRKVEVVIGDLPPCRGDVILLKQALLNLLSNALKFTRKRDAARIEVGAEIRNGEYVGYVRDNGVGFDMRYADKLFEVFQRLHGGSEFEGTGVGLAIVKRVFERHGGRVWVEAVPDQGAMFYFSLPV